MHENGRALNVYQPKYPMWLPGPRELQTPFSLSILPSVATCHVDAAWDSLSGDCGLGVIYSGSPCDNCSPAYASPVNLSLWRLWLRPLPSASQL